MKNEPIIKPIWNSLTIQIALVDFLINCTYIIEEAFSTGGVTNTHIVGIVRHFLFAIGIIYGRTRATSILYSDKYLPGFDKEKALTIVQNQQNHENSFTQDS